MVQLFVTIAIIWAFGYVVAQVMGFGRYYLAWWKRRWSKVWPKYKTQVIWFIVGMLFGGFITP